MTAAGFALTLYVFYPGVMTFDALYIYKDMAKGTFGDWQSPAMLALWSLIDPIAPGTGSILLLTVALYWLTFALAALAIARHSPRLAVLVPILALSPPAFVLVGVIWRDILFAIVWMLARRRGFRRGRTRLEIARSGPDHRARCFSRLASCCGRMRSPPRPLLAAYLIWPKRFSWKRTALLYVPAALGLYGLVQVDLLRRLRRATAASAALDHGVRPWRHFPFRQGKRFSRHLDRRRRATLITDGCYQADRMGHLLDATAMFVRDATSRRRKTIRHALLSPLPGGGRSSDIRSPICSTASLFIGRSSPARAWPCGRETSTIPTR